MKMARVEAATKGGWKKKNVIATKSNP